MLQRQHFSISFDPCVTSPVAMMSRRHIRQDVFTVLRKSKLRRPVVNRLLRVQNSTKRVINHNRDLRHLGVVPSVILSLPHFISTFIRVLRLRNLRNFMVFTFTNFTRSIHLLSRVPSRRMNRNRRAKVYSKCNRNSTGRTNIRRQYIINKRTPRRGYYKGRQGGPSSPPGVPTSKE